MRRELARLDGPPSLTDCLQGGVRGCEGDLGGDGLPCKPLASVGCCDLSFIALPTNAEISAFLCLFLNLCFDVMNPHSTPLTYCGVTSVLISLAVVLHQILMSNQRFFVTREAISCVALGSGDVKIRCTSLHLN